MKFGKSLYDVSSAVRRKYRGNSASDFRLYAGEAADSVLNSYDQNQKVVSSNSMVSSGLLEYPLYLVISFWVSKSASRKSSQNCGDGKLFTINWWYFVEIFTLYFLNIEQSMILHKQRIIFDSFIRTNAKVK